MQAHEIHWHEWWWPHELIWIIFVLVLVALVLVSVRPLIRSWLIRQNPEEIVKWRFARGEVDEEEFEKILKRLRG
ncbi:MAG: hypothetical protein BGO25_19910 [Acidobacteriales bacterium 59-55]|nr:hypothetical protein [Terriglobales bacterium]OJV41894.1 MAG: hypothetical protein BGO25_19910 [Acidobacteriales bacterium 59-55]